MLKWITALVVEQGNLMVGPLIRIESCQIAAGETSGVAITGQNIPNPGLAGYQISVSVQYDPQKFEVTISKIMTGIPD